MSVKRVVYPTHVPQTAPTLSARAAKVGKKTELSLKISSLFGGIARSAAAAIELILKMSPGVKIALSASKFPNILRGLISIKTAAKDAQDVIACSKSL